MCWWRWGGIDIGSPIIYAEWIPKEPLRRHMNPPVEPELEDCCRSGCTPCVFDLYSEALERYEAWLAAQPKPGQAAPEQSSS